MKRTVLRLMTVLLVIGLVGCGSSKSKKPENVSDEVYNHGVAVVEVMDKYLDDKVDWEEVGTVIFGSEVVFETNEERAIENEINVVWKGVIRFYDNKEKTIEFRNALADLLNLEARE